MPLGLSTYFWFNLTYMLSLGAYNIGPLGTLKGYY